MQTVEPCSSGSDTYECRCSTFGLPITQTVNIHAQHACFSHTWIWIERISTVQWQSLIKGLLYWAIDSMHESNIGSVQGVDRMLRCTHMLAGLPGVAWQSSEPVIMHPPKEGMHLSVQRRAPPPPPPPPLVATLSWISLRLQGILTSYHKHCQYRPGQFCWWVFCSAWLTPLMSN